MTPYDRAWEMGIYTEYMWVYDGICQVVRIPDAADSYALPVRRGPGGECSSGLTFKLASCPACNHYASASVQS